MEARQVGSPNSAADEAWSGEESAAFDRYLQQELGLPPPLLMENAGAALAGEAAQLAEECGLARIVLMCGPGNNGGDGLVAARHLAGRFPCVEVALPLGGDERRLRPLSGLGLAAGRLRIHPAGAPVPAGESLLVDALFGLGLSRPLTGPAREAVEAAACGGRPILAADLPSGLAADSGEVLGAAVCARRTLTFVAPKRGMLRGRGPEFCGEIRVAGIGVTAAVAAAWLRARRAAARD